MPPHPPIPVTAASTPAPPPPLPSAAPFPHLVSSGGQRTYSCSPGTAGLQPHGLPAPRMPPPPQLMLCLQPPAAPLSLLCLFCPMLGSVCPWGGGPGLASLSPLTLKAELGTGGQGGLQRRGGGQAGGGGPRVPPLPHCCSSAATRDRGSVLFCTSWPSPLYFPPPPLVLLWGAVDGSVDPQRGPPGGV